MFRRLWSSLPRDPIFASDLKELGYFVNDQDEIRLIADSKFYFKFFSWRNDRHNERQRFHFNEAVERLVHERLEAEGLKKYLLPFCTAPTEAHAPIFASGDVASKSRVIVIFGQSEQELGVLAHRIIGGPGGVNKGSMVSVVQAIKAQQKSGRFDTAAPGIILANMGALWWWPEGSRALNDRSRLAVPMKSAVHRGRYYDPETNAVPGNATPQEHVEHMFEEVLPKLVDGSACLDVVLLGDATDFVESYLDNDEKWAVWGPRLNSLSIVAGLYDKKTLKCEGFKGFLAEKARAWVVSSETLDHPLSGPQGNPKTSTFTGHGCPVFSSGEPCLVETAFIKCYTSVLAFIQEVAVTTDYTNPEIIVTFADLEEGGDTWGTEGEAEKKTEIMTKDEFDDMMKEADAAVEPKDTPEDADEVEGEKV